MAPQQPLGWALWVQEDPGANPEILLLAKDGKRGATVHHHLLNVQTHQASMPQEVWQDAALAYANQTLLGLEHGLHHQPATQQAKQQGLQLAAGHYGQEHKDGAIHPQPENNRRA